MARILHGPLGSDTASLRCADPVCIRMLGHRTGAPVFRRPDRAQCLAWLLGALGLVGAGIRPLSSSLPSRCNRLVGEDGLLGRVIMQLAEQIRTVEAGSVGSEALSTICRIEMMRRCLACYVDISYLLNMPTSWYSGPVLIVDPAASSRADFLPCGTYDVRIRCKTPQLVM
jgi:hypothetical protein